MPIRILCTLVLSALLVVAGLNLSAQESTPPADANTQQVRDLVEALRIEELLEIVRNEGIDHAADLEQDMFPGRGGDRWLEMVGAIYDPARMTDTILNEMATERLNAHVGAMLDFHRSDLGREVVGLELSARRAMLDSAVEEAGNLYLDTLADENAGRMDLLQDFVATNGLVESNVSGALNANFAFYRGLNAGGAFGNYRTDRDMLREIWQQEGEIRADTELWVLSYVALAYQPLDDSRLADYLAFSRTRPGRILNAEIFSAFNEVFVQISFELGLAASQFIGGEDL